MSIDFATLQGLTIPEGVVTKIEDASGRVLWALQAGSDKVILEVEKIVSDTYAGETTYTGEEFILLDIYPKTNGTVSVTYGGLTKTITDTSGAAEPNAQQVFFGTFNGVSDSVETPASGTLTIDGDCYAFACGAYSKSKVLNSEHCFCVTKIENFGGITEIPDNAFGYASTYIDTYGGTFEAQQSIRIPQGVTKIGDYAFLNCAASVAFNIPRSVDNIGKNPWKNRVNLTIDDANTNYKIENTCLIEKSTNRLIHGDYVDIVPDAITTIDDFAFFSCDTISNVTIGANVTTIGNDAFNGCKISNVTIGANVTTIGVRAFVGQSVEAMTVRMLATTPPTIDVSVDTFNYKDGSGETKYPTIIVPKGCGEVYKATAGWTKRADCITEAS